VPRHATSPLACVPSVPQFRARMQPRYFMHSDAACALNARCGAQAILLRAVSSSSFSGHTAFIDSLFLEDIRMSRRDIRHSNSTFEKSSPCVCSNYRISAHAYLHPPTREVPPLSCRLFIRFRAIPVRIQIKIGQMGNCGVRRRIAALGEFERQSAGQHAALQRLGRGAR